jgi:hypothetical protein
LKAQDLRNQLRDSAEASAGRQQPARRRLGWHVIRALVQMG